MSHWMRIQDINNFLNNEYCFIMPRLKDGDYLDITRTGGHLIEFQLIESVDRKFLIKQAFDRKF